MLARLLLGTLLLMWLLMTGLYGQNPQVRSSMKARYEAQRVVKALKESQDHRDRKAIKGIRETQAQKELQVHKELSVLPVLKETPVLKVFQVPQARKEILVLKERQVHKVHKGFLARYLKPRRMESITLDGMHHGSPFLLPLS